MPYYSRQHQLQDSIVYHIMNRGNGKHDIFHSDQDKYYFKHLLSTYACKKPINIYHWVIMPSHYHFLIELAIPEMLSSVMAGINRSYTYYYHRKYGTVGFLWQGRFKSQPVQKDQYLLTCGRYIERNPVRIGLVCFAEEYTYSSARYYVRGEQDAVATESPVYISFGKNTEERQANYKEFLLDFDPQDSECYNNCNKIIGDESFRQRLIKKHGHYFPRRQGRLAKKNKIFVP